MTEHDEAVREKAAREIRRYRLAKAPDGVRLFKDETRIDGPWAYAEILAADEALSLAQADAALSAPSQSGAAEGWRVVPCEASPEMLAAAEAALSDWRKTLDRDEAMMRSYQAHDRKFIASATPAEKHAIRWRAMLAAAPPPPVGP